MSSAMPENLMSIREGRSIFMAVRANLQTRIIARVIMISWYNILQYKYEKAIRFKNTHRHLYVGAGEMMISWYNILVYKYEKVIRFVKTYRHRCRHLHKMLVAGSRKIATDNSSRRWNRMRDLVQSSSEEEPL